MDHRRPHHDFLHPRVCRDGAEVRKGQRRRRLCRGDRRAALRLLSRLVHDHHLLSDSDRDPGLAHCAVYAGLSHLLLAGSADADPGGGGWLRHRAGVHGADDGVSGVRLCHKRPVTEAGGEISGGDHGDQADPPWPDGGGRHPGGSAGTESYAGQQFCHRLRFSGRHASGISRRR